MNIQTLRYVVKIEDYGSINKAAQQLFVSQSTLSRDRKLKKKQGLSYSREVIKV